MRTIKLSSFYVIPVERITSCFSLDTSPLGGLLKTAKAEERYIDLTCGKKTKSIVTYDNGGKEMFVATTTSLPTIVSRMNGASETSSD